MSRTRRLFLLSKRRRLLSRSIAQAKRALDPHTWAVASPLPSPRAVDAFHNHIRHAKAAERRSHA
jgi:hypothetical protein